MSREQELEDLLRDTLQMLHDLHENYGWDGLQRSLEDVQESAAELGVHLET